MNLSFDFTGRTVLITGAAQGIGWAVADLFERANATVIPTDCDPVALNAAWGDRARAVPRELDVTNSSAAVTLVDQLRHDFGSVDIVVNNAGITRDGVVWKMTDDAWNAVIGVHLTGTFNVSRAVLPVMRERGFGRIINVTSYTGLHGNIGQANYAAAKAGIIGFTKSVAKEVARFGITANAISPNAETAMVAAIPDVKKTALTALVPMGRFGTPSEMAAAVAYLACEEAGYLTGVVLPVDGGMSI